MYDSMEKDVRLARIRHIQHIGEFSGTEPSKTGYSLLTVKHLKPSVLRLVEIKQS